MAFERGCRSRVIDMYPVNDYRDYLRHNDEDLKYGLPDKKKYPMLDRAHVMSAIKFFNYVSPSDEKELARNILKRIKEYGIEDINVGENNRFGKYYRPDNDYRNYIKHHGILGMKWGVQNGPPYPLGASDHSASEKKAGWQDSLNKESEKNEKLDHRKELTESGFKLDKTYTNEDGETWEKGTFDGRPCWTTVDIQIKDHTYPFNGKDGNPLVIKASTKEEISKTLKNAKSFESNFKKYEPSIKKTIAESMCEDGWGWYDGDPKDLKKSMKLEFVGFSAKAPDIVTISYFDKDGLVGYHSLESEFDLKTKKTSKNVAVNG